LIDEEKERGNSRLHLEIMDKQNVVNNEVIKISNKEASSAIETLLNYVSQSSEFCEEDFNKIKNLSERLEK
jgi:hypothetical protein